MNDARFQPIAASLPATRHQPLDPQSSRRAFLRTVAASMPLGLALAGCEQEGGIAFGPREGMKPEKTFEVSGIILNVYSDGELRIDYNPFKLAVHALLWAEVVPASLVGLANAALILYDHRQSLKLVLEAATSTLESGDGNPRKVLELDVAKLPRSGTVEVKTSSKIKPFLIQENPAEFDLNGSWVYKYPDGQPTTCTFTARGTDGFRLTSTRFDADFSITSAGTKSWPEGKATVYRGKTAGSFREDTSRRTPHATLYLLVRDARTIDAESYVIRWNEKGEEVSRIWWPFRMTKRV